MVEDDLDNAYALAKDGDTASAFDICDRLLKEHSEDKINILRKRSHINAYVNDLDNALSDRLEVIALGSKSPQDYFFAGVYSSELRKYDEAIELLGSSIAHSEAANDQRYLAESYLLRAYACIGVGKFNEALSDCDNVADDVEYFIEGDGPVSKKRLVSYISKKS